jgi:hypothetical protein
MANPLTTIYSGTSIQTSFGQPLYSLQTTNRTIPGLGTTTTGRAGGLGTTGRAGGLGTASVLGGTQNIFAASSGGARRSLPYTVVIGFPYQPPAPLRMSTNLQQVVSTSERLPSRSAIQVLTDGSTIVLRGQVRDAHESRLAEAIIRLEPGVYRVRNELTVPSAERVPWAPDSLPCDIGVALHLLPGYSTPFPRGERWLKEILALLVDGGCRR